jgi:hypothetical protein
MAVNLKSAFLITQAVLPPMRAARWGRIINLSSVAAQTGGVVGPHYATLADGVLWDEDWKDNESLLDADPKASRAVKKLMGDRRGLLHRRAARSDRRGRWWASGPRCES